MSHPNDDMVITPKVKPGGAKTAGEQAQSDRAEREKAGNGKRRRTSMMKRAAIARRLKILARRSGNAVAKGAGVADSISWIPEYIKRGIKYASYAAAAAYVARTYANRSFEAQSAIVNEILLGDVDDRARASARARQNIIDDPLASRFGTGGGNEQRYRELFKIYLREEHARSAILTDIEGGGRFDIHGKSDVAIRKANKVLEQAWKEAEMPSLLRRIWAQEVNAAKGYAR